MHFEHNHTFSDSTGIHTENPVAIRQQSASPDMRAPRLNKLMAATPEMLTAMFTNSQVLKKRACSIVT
jgi:hypothetical protein